MQTKTDTSVTLKSGGLVPYMSPVGAWVFALGTSIGWGSLVVTSNTYLAQAGPLGSTLGTVIGMIIMIIVSRNYHYMMNCYPDAGGVYAFAKHAFGHDHGFLTAWFLGLTYLAMFWANATSLPLFARYFLGNIFQFGFHYRVFGYEVYLGEALLSIVFILLAALLCSGNRKVVAGIMTVMVIFFAVVIAVCFIAAVSNLHAGGHTWAPGFVPDKSSFEQVVRIACISPWAFIGFENISHSSEEFRFRQKKSFRILLVAVITTTLLYIFVMLLSVSAYPPEYSTWQAYIQDLPNLEGIKGLPAFYAARFYLGELGLVLLVLALLALIFTSLIGNMVALSRLFYALSKDHVLPSRFGELNRNHVPAKAMLLVAVISCILPWFGRTAIGWIVDVTTLGATIVYGYVSLTAFKTARMRGDKTESYTGMTGLIFMVAIGLFLLLPSLFRSDSMATESYFLFAIWSIAGFFFFRYVMSRDKERRFGRSIIVWVVLLSLVLFVSLVWMGQTTLNSTGKAMQDVQEFFSEQALLNGYDINADAFMAQEIGKLQSTNTLSMIVVIAMFALSLITLVNIYSLMRKRADASEAELGFVKDLANKDPLTGVKSKHAYAENERLMNTMIADGKAEDFSVVVCDVNGLKYVNDSQGHKAGDAYICSASAMICDVFQHSPVFRVGGDEFVVILSGRSYDERQNLLSVFNRRVEENLSKGEVVVSAGYSDYIAGMDADVHAVFERADQLMYQRKKALKAMGAITR